jgi:hypothetical protein
MSDARAFRLRFPSSIFASGIAERWYSEKRLGGLSRFAVAITILNIAGHCLLGFEQPWIAPFVALGAAYATEFVGEIVEAVVHRRSFRFGRSLSQIVQFLLPAHITALATSMLLYAGEQLAVVGFAAAAAIASKYMFRISWGKTAEGVVVRRHFLNPSNFGITVTLLLFPSVGVAPPYQFSEDTWGSADWLLPLLIVSSGTYLNSQATGRIPLIAGWLTVFALQALVRSAIHGTPWAAGLYPMTGFAFILFTFYMITDPATSPTRPRNQIIFGAAVATTYAVLMELHAVFGLFYALTIVTASRGGLLALSSRLRS